MLKLNRGSPGPLNTKGHEKEQPPVLENPYVGLQMCSGGQGPVHERDE